jgi:glycosyltransferase involved in cell wall biosynthesis
VIGSLGLGGAETQMAALIRQLGSFGYLCSVFVLEPAGPVRRCLEQAGISIYEGGYVSTWPRPQKMLLLFLAQLRLTKVMLRLKPDIVHCYLPLTNFMGAAAGCLTGVSRVIISKRALGTHQDRNKGWRPFDVAAFRISKIVTANSRAVAEDTVIRDKGHLSKIRVIYNGIDADRLFYDPVERRQVRERTRRSLEIPENVKVVTAVANLIPYKGHADLIEAAADVVKRMPQSMFFMVGEDRGIGRRLCEMVRTLNLKDHVRFLGQRHDIADILVASDLAVLPSHEEGFSNVILEAMAAGLPVVATRVGGNPEAIVEGQTGWLVPPKDPAALAEKILDSISDPAKAARWGEAGRQRVQDLFSIDRMVAEHVELYEEILTE